jgi:hypothetical protein
LRHAAFPDHDRQMKNWKGNELERRRVMLGNLNAG